MPWIDTLACCLQSALARCSQPIQNNHKQPNGNKSATSTILRIDIVSTGALEAGAGARSPAGAGSRAGSTILWGHRLMQLRTAVVLTDNEEDIHTIPRFHTTSHLRCILFGIGGWWWQISLQMGDEILTYSRTQRNTIGLDCIVRLLYLVVPPSVVHMYITR